MMNKEELIDIIRLANLSLELEDPDSILNDISGAVSIIQSITDVDLSGYDCNTPGVCYDTIVSKFRDDVAEPSLPVDIVLSNAVSTQDNFFTV